RFWATLLFVTDVGFFPFTTYHFLRKSRSRSSMTDYVCKIYKELRKLTIGLDSTNYESQAQNHCPR
ncbi:MAG: hypothetical protein ACKN9K_25575, partial [Dolichospermum sp.]